jgi:hypothetical protein
LRVETDTCPVAEGRATVVATAEPVGRGLKRRCAL